MHACPTEDGSIHQRTHPLNRLRVGRAMCKEIAGNISACVELANEIVAVATDRLCCARPFWDVTSGPAAETDPEIGLWNGCIVHGSREALGPPLGIDWLQWSSEALAPSTCLFEIWHPSLVMRASNDSARVVEPV